MLEIIIFGGAGNGNYLPNSGPGNKKVLKGSKQNGWFGMIDPSYMPTIQEVGKQAGMITLPDYTGANPARPAWMKAVIDDKVIFLPNGPWTGDISYWDCYRAGVVFGVDGISPDNTSRPSAALSSYNQLKYVDWIDPTGKAWLFKVRFIKGNAPIVVASTGAVNSDTSSNSEAYQLFWRTRATSTASEAERWDSLVSGVDYYQFRYFDQTYIPSGDNRSIGGTTALPDVGQWWGGGSTNKFPWCPVLEVVSPDDTFIYPIGVTFVTRQSTPLAPVISSDTRLMVAGDVDLQNQRTIPLAALVSSDAFTVANAVSFTNMAVAPINPIMS
ncbi:hypothetical protein pEaSNUABM37_00109 [Erwinia phage pEa_SNUABM_37]|nr:hypothetical protein pEaSNUABM37_00109 [Erwinia phage pEa_SNUABM_37]QXO10579.1 hypothetical protein pEaSNUABM48_00109 [Erwinia phage pEa_SNUABM_48]